jgi:hypothetical protein
MESHTKVAAGNIAPSRFVVLTSADGKVVQAAAATDKLYGISHQGTRRAPFGGLDDGYAAIAGENLCVYGLGAKDVLLEIGAGGCAQGDRLTSDVDGKGIKTITDHNEYGAIAQVAGVAGDLIYVEVMSGQVSL